MAICPPTDWRNQIPRTIVQPGYARRKQLLGK
jgi:hypothetical protein